MATDIPTIVLEYMLYKDLKTFLFAKSGRELARLEVDDHECGIRQEDLFFIGLDVAKGLEFLASKQVLSSGCTLIHMVDLFKAGPPLEAIFVILVVEP